MCRWIALSFLIIATTSAQAGWRLESSHEAAAFDGVRHVVKSVSDGSRRVTLHLAVFETPGHNLRVIDDPSAMRVPEAMRREGCIAGVNGGYFHPGYEPAGLVVSGGKMIHKQEKARLLSGVIAATKDRLYVLRYSEFKLGPRTQDAIQAGPFLIDDGRAVAGLKGDRRAYRTSVLTDGGRRHALLVTESLTLAELAEVLATPGVIGEFKLKRALNLDGGTSTGFYFGGDTPFDITNMKRVRNCLGVVAR